MLYDVKHANTARHREATGVPNERILDNLRKDGGQAGAQSIGLPSGDPPIQ